MFYVYPLASKPYGTLYVGVTSELARRAAIRREKQIKEWKRDWKFNLIEHDNPHWIDLYPNLTGL